VQPIHLVVRATSALLVAVLFAACSSSGTSGNLTPFSAAGGSQALDSQSRVTQSAASCTPIVDSTGTSFTAARVGGGDNLDVEYSGDAPPCDIGIYVGRPAHGPAYLGHTVVNGPFRIGIYVDNVGSMMQIDHTSICVNGTNRDGSCASGAARSTGTGLDVRNTPNINIDHTDVDGYTAGFATNPCPNSQNDISGHHMTITNFTDAWSFQGGKNDIDDASPAPPNGGSCAGSSVGAGVTPPVTPPPTPAPGTLYVSGTDRVNAFDIAANGNASPIRTIFPFPNQTDGITGIATAADATLDILQDYVNPASAHDCRVVKESPTANGGGSGLNQLECNTNPIPSAGVSDVRGRGVARGPNFEIDILDSLQGGQLGDYVQRTNFNSAPPYNIGFIGPLNGAAGTHHGIAEDAGGHIFISSSSAGAPIVYAGNASTAGCSPSATGAATIDNYAPGAPSNAAPLHTFTIVGRTAAGAIALSPDNATLYVATCDTSGQLFVDSVMTPGTSGAVHPIQSIGPFGNNNVAALAVDAQGELYMGLTANDGSGQNHVRVYELNAGSGKPAPLRILQNPIPVTANQRITGLAISQ
jgi:hypothetical protein